VKTLRKNLSLYVALLCIVGIIAIFFLDAYFGIYDTLYITQRGAERQVGFEQWEQGERRVEKYGGGASTVGVYYGEVLNFKYDIANRRFGKYSTYIEASAWKGEEKIWTLLSGDELIKPFDEAAVEWKLETEGLKEYRELAAPYTNYTVKIKTERVERRIILQVNEEVAPVPLKVPPPPPR
jgi:hypothetical protein